jgi:RND superfamily putative drug exporter
MRASSAPITTEGKGSMEAHEKSLVARAAHWSTTHRKTAIFGWIAFVVVAIVIGNSVGKNEMTNADGYSGEAGVAQQALDDKKLEPNTEMVLVQGDGTLADTPEFQQIVNQLTTGLKDARYVDDVRSPLDGEAAIADGGRTALVEYDVAGTLDDAEDRVQYGQAVTDRVAEKHPDYVVEQYGAASAHKAMSETVDEDLHKAESISMPITLGILLFAFGSLVAAGLPMILAISAVMATMALVALPSQVFPVNDNVASIILLVGLAVGVDYSLFYLRREREERAAGKDSETALAIASATSGHAVLVSGLTVIAAMSGMYLTGDKTFTSLASGAVMVVAIAMVASISVLPALMSWLGDRVDLGKLPLRKRSKREGPGIWAAIIDRVMRRPLVAAVLAAGALIALSIPTLGLNTKVTSTKDLPHDVAVIQTYEKIQQSFPAETAKADVVVQAADVRHGATAFGIDSLIRQAGRTDLAVGEMTTTYTRDGTAALIQIPIAGTGSDDVSTAAVETLRNELIPASLGSVQGAEVNVTGEAAQSIDSDTQLSHSMPIVFAFVLALTFVLMLVTFRSIVIPIATIVLNMLSVGAAYGLLVLIFQNGLGESILGFDSNGGITSWLPLFLFVILFGLSMDYHVFILSRVREAHDSGMSTDEAVRVGITSTAGTVTSAAIVMVGVFATFATLTLIDMKEMGIGLAAAVLIDATVIRGVLLPATLKLLGDATWYMPKGLSRVRRARRADPHAEPAQA